MEKLLIRPYDKEYMRMAMLQHEETFKQQVHELHRLYQIQKRLMRSTDQSNRPNNSNGDAQKNSRTRPDLERPAMEAGRLITAQPSEVIDESKIELTLGPSSYTGRKKAATPLTSDSGGSLSSSSTESSHVNRTSNVGLKEELGMTLGFQRGNKTNSSTVVDVEEELMRQDRITQPPWLYKVLSLNMT